MISIVSKIDFWLYNRNKKSIIAKIKDHSNISINEYLKITIAFILSLIPTSFILLTAAYFIYVFITTKYLLPFFIFVLPFCVLSFLVFPRLFSKKSKEAVYYSRDAYPELFGELDRITELMKGKKIELVEINIEFNASVKTVGYKLERTLSLGAPLLTALSPNQILAIIGHEIAHTSQYPLFFYNIIDSGLKSLKHFQQMTLDGIYNTSGIIKILALPLIILLFTPIYIYDLLISLLVFADSQRAEFCADVESAKHFGSNNLINALKVLYSSSVIYECLQESEWQKIDFIDYYKKRMVEKAINSFDSLKDRKAINSLSIMTHPSIFDRIELLMEYNTVSCDMSSSVLLDEYLKVEHIIFDRFKQSFERYRNI